MGKIGKVLSGVLGATVGLANHALLDEPAAVPARRLALPVGIRLVKQRNTGRRPKGAARARLQRRKFYKAAIGLSTSRIVPPADFDGRTLVQFAVRLISAACLVD